MVLLHELSRGREWVTGRDWPEADCTFSVRFLRGQNQRIVVNGTLWAHVGSPAVAGRFVDALVTFLEALPAQWVGLADWHARWRTFLAEFAQTEGVRWVGKGAPGA